MPPFGLIELSVDFSPAGAGLYSGDLVISSDDPLRPQAYVPLFARSGSTVALSPTRLEFGSVALGSDKVLSLIVTNTGGTALDLGNVSASDPRFVPLAAFSTLAPGERGVVDVRFVPDGAQAFRGDLTLALTGGSDPAVSVRLVGTGE